MRIQPITSLDDLDDAIASAERDHQSRWYVARVAQAMGVTDRIPTTWDESQRQVETFRELSEDEQEAVSEHLSAISVEVDDYAHNRIGMEDLEDAALAASIAAGEYAEQFETGLVASVGVFAKYGKISDDEAEAIVAAAKKPRKVRTQAGVRRFKQPLHSVIMPGGKVLRPGDPGYDAADKAAGGSGSSSSKSQPKARINTSSSKSVSPKLSDIESYLEGENVSVTKNPSTGSMQFRQGDTLYRVMKDPDSDGVMIETSRNSALVKTEKFDSDSADALKSSLSKKVSSPSAPKAATTKADTARDAKNTSGQRSAKDALKSSDLPGGWKNTKADGDGAISFRKGDFQLSVLTKDSPDGKAFEWMYSDKRGGIKSGTGSSIEDAATQAAKAGKAYGRPEADEALPTAKADTADTTPKAGAIGGPNDKAAAKLVRSKLSEIAKAKTRDELRDIDLGELEEFVKSNDVHDDVKKMVEAVSSFKQNKGMWSDYRQRAANAFRPDDVSSARNSARNYSARAKNDRDKIKDILDTVAGKAPAAKLEWTAGKSFGSATVKADPGFKGDVFRDRSTGRYYANLTQDSQTILDKEFTSETAARRAIEDKIKTTKKGMDAGKSPKVIDPEVVKAGKDAAKAEKAEDAKATDAKAADTAGSGDPVGDRAQRNARVPYTQVGPSVMRLQEHGNDGTKIIRGATPGGLSIHGHQTKDGKWVATHSKEDGRAINSLTPADTPEEAVEALNARNKRRFSGKTSADAASANKEISEMRPIEEYYKSRRAELDSAGPKSDADPIGDRARKNSKVPFTQVGPSVARLQDNGTGTKIIHGVAPGGITIRGYQNKDGKWVATHEKENGHVQSAIVPADTMEEAVEALNARNKRLFSGKTPVKAADTKPAASTASPAKPAGEFADLSGAELSEAYAEVENAVNDGDLSEAEGAVMMDKMEAEAKSRGIDINTGEKSTSSTGTSARVSPAQAAKDKPNLLEGKSLSRMSDDDLKSYADTTKRNLDSAVSGGPTGKSDSAQVEALKKRDLAAREELARRGKGESAAKPSASSDKPDWNKPTTRPVVVSNDTDDWMDMDNVSDTLSAAKEAGVDLKLSEDKKNFTLKGPEDKVRKFYDEMIGGDSSWLDENGLIKFDDTPSSATPDRKSELADRAAALGDKTAKSAGRAGVAEDLGKKHGLSSNVVAFDLNSSNGELKATRRSGEGVIKAAKNELLTATGTRKTDLEDNIEKQRRRDAQIDEILAAREAGNVDYMRTQDAPVDKLSDERLKTAYDDAAYRARSARRPSWKRDASADAKKYRAEIERRKSSSAAAPADAAPAAKSTSRSSTGATNAADAKKLSNDELVSEINRLEDEIKAIPFGSKDRDVPGDRAHMFKKELASRVGSDYGSKYSSDMAGNAKAVAGEDDPLNKALRAGRDRSDSSSPDAATSTAERRADIATRATALGDKKMTPGRLDQRIRTVDKHLKGVQERIKARKDRGLNPTKAQLRDLKDLQDQMTELKARKSSAGSSASDSPSPSAAPRSAATPAPSAITPAGRQTRDKQALQDIAGLVEKMTTDFSNVDVRVLNKYINAEDGSIDPNLKAAAKRAKTAYDNKKKSMRARRSLEDKKVDIRNYNEARDHAKKLIKDTNLSGGDSGKA